MTGFVGFVEVKTAELEGAMLDWAVALAEGVPVALAAPAYGNGWRVRYDRAHDQGKYSPSAEWSQGGPLIEKYQIDLTFERKGTVYAYLCDDEGFPRVSHGDADEYGSYGRLYLVAACRAIVASVLGDTVQVPKELI